MEEVFECEVNGMVWDESKRLDDLPPISPDSMGFKGKEGIDDVDFEPEK